MLTKRLHHRWALGLIGIVGLAGVFGAASATGSGLGAASAQADFKIAYTHSSGPAWTSGDVFVMNADGSGQRNVSRAPGLDGGHVWSPDGRRIAFLSRRDGKQEIYVVNAAAAAVLALAATPATPA